VSQITIAKVLTPVSHVALLNEISSLEDRIRTRAFEIYQRRLGAGGTPRNDWLQAECELKCDLAAELSQTDADINLIVTIPCSAECLKVSVMPRELVVDVGFCRRFELPDAIDVDRVYAFVNNGVLHIAAPKARIKALTKSTPKALAKVA
jgi:HSP20 family molecular chaperone IbpA